VSGHLHRDGDGVDLWCRDQLGNVGEGARQAGRRSGLLGAGQAGVGDADDLEGLGQRAERRNMGPRRPLLLGCNPAMPTLKRCPVMMFGSPSRRPGLD
jgi:hypothetical protein